MVYFNSLLQITFTISNSKGCMLKERADEAASEPAYLVNIQCSNHTSRVTIHQLLAERSASS